MMIRYIVLLGQVEVIGPFNTEAEAEAYVASDWQKSEMVVLELYAPDDSADDRKQENEA
jgi:hypothetical protein